MRIVLLVLLFCLTSIVSVPEASTRECGTCFAECMLLTPDPDNGYHCVWDGTYFWKDCVLVQVGKFTICTSNCFCV